MHFPASVHPATDLAPWRNSKCLHFPAKCAISRHASRAAEKRGTTIAIRVAAQQIGFVFVDLCANVAQAPFSFFLWRRDMTNRRKQLLLAEERMTLSEKWFRLKSRSARPGMAALRQAAIGRKVFGHCDGGGLDGRRTEAADRVAEDGCRHCGSSGR